MSRIQIILIGTLGVILVFATIIYLRTFSAEFRPIFLWQLVVWSPWILFGYLNNSLDRRYPIVEQPVLHWVLRHSALCALIIAIHVAWFFFVASKFSPFLGMENTGYGAFFFFFIMWGICDFLFYWSLLGIYALRQLLSVAPSDSSPSRPDHFLLKTTGKQSSVLIKDILWIEAEDYCCRVHTVTKDHLVRQSLNSFEEMLPKPDFMRIHRSTIVNTRYVDAIEKQENRRHVARLRSGVIRAISPDGRKKLQTILENR